MNVARADITYHISGNKTPDTKNKPDNKKNNTWENKTWHLAKKHTMATEYNRNPEQDATAKIGLVEPHLQKEKDKNTQLLA